MSHVDTLVRYVRNPLQYVVIYDGVVVRGVICSAGGRVELVAGSGDTLLTAVEDSIQTCKDSNRIIMRLTNNGARVHVSCYSLAPIEFFA